MMPSISKSVLPVPLPLALSPVGNLTMGRMANATGAPMTYLAAGKQYVVFPVGGANLTEELIAVSLP